MNGGIRQRPHITELGAVINTREMLAEPRVPLLPSGEETWPLGGAPMGTPPGGMPSSARESLTRDGSRVWIPLAKGTLLTLAVPQEGWLSSRWDHPSHHPVSMLWAHCKKAASASWYLGKLWHWEGGELWGEDTSLKCQLHSRSPNPHSLASSTPGCPERD